MKIKKPEIKIDKATVLGGLLTALGVAQIFLGNKVQADDRKALKAELLEELSKGVKGS